jgi:hypothetical protein
MNTHRELVRELKSLRKGRGVFAGRIGERVGPNLRMTCGISGDDGPVTIRGKLLARLIEMADQLPEDMRLVTVAAFALSAEVRRPLYQERMHWAAARIDRDSRTVRRRVDEAIDYLAELVAITPRSATAAWHTAELHVAVAVDRPQPEVLEQHRIVAGQDALPELTCTSPLSARRDYQAADLLYGGTLRHDRSGLTLTLPEPLSQGETHDFAILFRLPNPRAILSYIMDGPDHPCELFDLRLRFRRERPPSHVWILRDAQQGAGPIRHTNQHPVNRAGEVHLRFRRLLPGLAYGAQWEAGRA